MTFAIVARLVNWDFHFIHHDIHLFAKRWKRFLKFLHYFLRLIPGGKVTYTESPERRFKKHHGFMIWKRSVNLLLLPVGFVLRSALVISRESLHLETPHTVKLRRSICRRVYRSWWSHGPAKYMFDAFVFVNSYSSPA